MELLQIIVDFASLPADEIPLECHEVRGHVEAMQEAIAEISALK